MEPSTRSGAVTRCHICLDPIFPRPRYQEEEGRQLPDCNHIFHRECIDEWLALRQEPLPKGKRFSAPPNSLKLKYTFTEEGVCSNSDDCPQCQDLLKVSPSEMERLEISIQQALVSVREKIYGARRLRILESDEDSLEELARKVATATSTKRNI